MGWPEIAEKQKIRRPKLVAAAVFTGPIRALPAAVGQKFLLAWSSGRPPPPCLARLQ